MLKILIKYITITLIVIVISACSSKPAKEVTFEGRSVIKKGETATLKWHYKNASSVTVGGFNVAFGANDSVTVSPNETKNYQITAHNNDETQKDDWLVEVVKDNAEKKKALKKLNVTDKISNVENESVTDSTFILPSPTNLVELNKTSTSPAPNSVNLELKESNIESNLLRGVSFSTNSVTLKINKVTKTTEGYKLNLLFLDNYGNFIKNVDLGRAFINYVNQSGSSDFKISKPELYTESQSTNYAFLVEKSYSDSISNINRSIIKDVIYPLIKSNDNISYIEFNQSNFNIVDKINKNDLQNFNLTSANIPKSPLTSLYQNAFECANLIKKDKGLKNLIIINYGFDNASLVHTPKDLVMLCLKNDIKVYFVSIGTDIDSYTEREISAQTGGKYYNIDNSTEIADAIREITFSNQSFYQLFISDEALAGYTNPDVKIKLNIYANGANLIEYFKLPILNKLPNPGEKIIALFDLNSDVLSTKYEFNIDNMAKIFNDNPEIPILLKGHTGLECDLQNNLDLSQRRADKVKEKLMSIGVKSEIIEPKGYANAKPLFPLEIKDWQKMLNKRVSFKFLNTETKPFEIIAESAYSEIIAIKKVEEWEKRGFNAYYERFTQNNNPGYLIKIWGFPTKIEAQKTAQKINEKFKVETEVDFE